MYSMQLFIAMVVVLVSSLAGPEMADREEAALGLPW